MNQITRVYFFDSRVENIHLLVSQLPPGASWYVIPADVDGLSYIADTLANYQNLDSVHLVSHGDDASLSLGSTTLTSSNIDQYGTELSAIGGALSEEGDLLLYGCDVAATDEGKSFVDSLSATTGADVAASDDITGALGDSALEYSSGDVTAEVLNLSGVTSLGVFTGTDGDDTLTGTESADTLTGAAGNDLINALGGDDYIEDGTQNDTILAGAGNDTINNIGGSDSFDGGEGVDTLISDVTQFAAGEFVINFDTTTGVHGRQNSDVGQDTISGLENFTTYGTIDAFVKGGDEANSFSTDAGSDTLDGGAGNDTISAGAGIDSIIGSSGEDVVDGGDGEDFLDYSGFGTAIKIDSNTGIASDGLGNITNFSGIEDFIGTAFDDELYGRDTDTSIGVEFNAVSGDIRNYEYFRGGDGADYIDGRGGYDEIQLSLSPVALTIDLATDTQADGFGNTDTVLNIEGVEATNFDDTIYGNSEDNSLDGRFGNDYIDGRGGFDFAEYNGSSRTGLVANLATGIAQYERTSDNTPYTDTLVNIEGVIGTANSDSITGDSGVNKLYGGDGNDILSGAGGDDFLQDGSGNDSVYGGEGNDTINNIGGSDLFDGGSGEDTLITNVTGIEDGIIANAGVPAESIAVGFNANLGTHGVIDSSVGQDTVTSIENFTFIGNMDAVAIGDSGNNRLVTDLGDDTLEGGAGDDYLYAGSGNNSLSGGDGQDFIRDGQGNETILGGSGNDTIEAWDGGSDSINAGAGDDKIYSDAWYFQWNDTATIPTDRVDTVDGGDGYDVLTIDTWGGNPPEGTFTTDVLAAATDGSSATYRVYANDDPKQDFRVVMNSDGSGTIAYNYADPSDPTPAPFTFMTFSNIEGLQFNTLNETILRDWIGGSNRWAGFTADLVNGVEQGAPQESWYIPIVGTDGNDNLVLADELSALGYDTSDYGLTVRINLRAGDDYIDLNGVNARVEIYDDLGDDTYFKSDFGNEVLLLDVGTGSNTFDINNEFVMRANAFESEEGFAASTLSANLAQAELHITSESAALEISYGSVLAQSYFFNTSGELVFREYESDGVTFSENTITDPRQWKELLTRFRSDDGETLSVLQVRAESDTKELSYILSEAGTTNDVVGDAEDNFFRDTELSEHFFGLEGNDRIEAWDGGNDTLDGGAGDDTLWVDAWYFQREGSPHSLDSVIGGEGYDVLHLDTRGGDPYPGEYLIDLVSGSEGGTSATYRVYSDADPQEDYQVVLNADGSGEVYYNYYLDELNAPIKFVEFESIERLEFNEARQTFLKGDDRLRWAGFNLDGTAVTSLNATDPLAAVTRTFNFGESTYYLIDSDTSYAAAQAYATALGGYLLEIDSEAENQFVFESIIPTLQWTNRVYLGISDQAYEGLWMTDDGRILEYSDWGEFEPNDWHDGEDIAVIELGNFFNGENDLGGWNDGQYTGVPFVVEVGAQSAGLSYRMSTLTVDTFVAGDNLLFGGDGSQRLTAADTSSWIYAAGGNDTLTGGNGDDTLQGGAGNDLLSGALGHDSLSGEEGADTLSGEAGDDTLRGGEGNDSLRGGEGNDELFGNQGDDVLDGGSGDDYLDGQFGADTLFGGDGSDRFRLDNENAVANQVVDGGTGRDTVDYGHIQSAVTIDLAAGTATGDGIGSDTLTSIERVVTTQFNDTVYGSDRDDEWEIFVMGTGDDWADGRGGNDFIANGQAENSVTVDLSANKVYGGALGTDTIFNFEGVGGSNYSDTLIGDDGDNVFLPDDQLGRSHMNNYLVGGVDTVDGGLGVDGVSYSNTYFQGNELTGIQVDLALGQLIDPAGNQDVLISIENAVGTSSSDTFRGDAGNNKFEGLDGDDQFYAGAGQDTVFGGEGADTLYVNGNRADYVLGTGLETTYVLTTIGNPDDSVSFSAIESIVFNDETLEITEGISGKVYHWNSHQLLDNVEVRMNSELFTTTDSLFGLANLRVGDQGETIVDVTFDAGTDQIDTVDLTLTFDAEASGSFVWNSTLQADGWQPQVNPADASTSFSAFKSSGTSTGLLTLGTLSLTGVDSTDFNVGLINGVTALTNLETFHADTTAGAVSYRFDTDSVGGFSGVASDSLDYTLDGVRELTEVETGRVVSASDALSALKLAVGINPNATLEVSPYQLLAADVNQDGRVSAADALSILKMAVGLEGAPEREWIFINETEDFLNADETVFNRQNIEWEQLNQFTGVGDFNMVALLKGDVNGSWPAPEETGLETLPDSYFTDLEAAGVAPAEQWWVV